MPFRIATRTLLQLVLLGLELVPARVLEQALAQELVPARVLERALAQELVLERGRHRQVTHPSVSPK